MKVQQQRALHYENLQAAPFFTTHTNYVHELRREDIKIERSENMYRGRGSRK